MYEDRLKSSYDDIIFVIYDFFYQWDSSTKILMEDLWKSNCRETLLKNLNWSHFMFLANEHFSQPSYIYIYIYIYIDR